MWVTGVINPTKWSYGDTAHLVCLCMQGWIFEESGVHISMILVV